MPPNESEPLLAHARFESINGDCDSDADSIHGGEEAPTKNQLGAINGVYVPCLLNILGAVLFMKIGYSVGYAGFLGTVCIFIFSEYITIMTALSFSAIVTNGKMRGGGAYFMISRAIGPAFGGATGLMFYCCYVANAAFNAQAFVQDITSTFMEDVHGQKLQDYTYYLYHSTLFVLLIIAYNGAGAFAKVNIFLFVVLISTILISFGSLIFSHEKHLGSYNLTHRCPFDDPQIPYPVSGTLDVTYSPPSLDRFRSNFWPSAPTFDINFPDFWSSSTTNNMPTVMALVFTSTCGVMEGANLSGDLKNPAKALPKGTLFAQLTSFSTYILFALFLALCFDRRSLMCEFNVVQKAALSPYVVVAGIAMATLSTTLGALFGAARVLQAIARDECFPFSFFKKGAKKGDEPQRAVILTYLLSNAFIYMSGQSLNDIGNILTDFFLTAYAFVNLSQALLAFSGAPNYRPTFNWTSVLLSLSGFVASLALMWFLNPIYAAITCFTWFTIFLYIWLTSSPKNWGSVSQAILYRFVAGTQKWLKQKSDNVKFWRPNILVLAQDVDVPMLKFCAALASNGTLIIGATHTDKMKPRREISKSTLRNRKGGIMDMLPDFKSPVASTKAAWLWVSEQAKLSAMVQIGTGHNVAEVFQTLISCAGLGALTPNTVAVPIYDDVSSQKASNDYVGRITDQLQVMDYSSKEKEGGKNTVIDAILWHPPSYNSTMKECAATEYVSLLQHVLDVEKNVMVMRKMGRLEKVFGRSAITNSDSSIESGHSNVGRFVDVWIFGEWDWELKFDSVAVLLQHAHLVAKKLGKEFQLRIIQSIRNPSKQFHKQKMAELELLAEEARIRKPILQIVEPISHDDAVLDANLLGEEMTIPSRASDKNGVVKKYSTDSAIVFLPLPTMPMKITDGSAKSYIVNLASLTEGLPPTVLMQKGEPTSIFSSEI